MKERIAVVGVSIDNKKWGYKIFRSLSSDSIVYPVNPKYGEIDGERCYPNLSSLPAVPNMVITVVPPEVTEKIVVECSNMGIKKVWMQPGSESEEAVKYCKKKGIKTVSGACIIRDV